MKTLRNKFCIAIFFALISGGQAYPMAAVFKIAEAHQCSCNQQGRKCIHGCDLSYRHGGKAQRHAHHVDQDQMGGPNPHEGHHGHHASHQETESHHPRLHASPHQRDESRHAEASHWVAPRCSQDAKLKLLSMQSDPFLLSLPQAWRATLWSVSWEEPSPFFQDPILLLESPPPRLG